MAGLKKFFRVLYIKLFRINDTPHRVAGGMAVGVFCGMAPGMGPIAAVALALLFRTNRAAALIGSIATNTWISIVTFAVALKAGTILTGTNVSAVQQRWQSVIADFYFADLVKFSFYELVFPVVVGYLVVSIALAASAYLLTFLIIKFARSRKRHIVFMAMISAGLFTVMLAQRGEGKVEKATSGAGKIRIYNARNKVVDLVDRVVKTDEQWKQILTPEQYDITRKKGT